MGLADQLRELASQLEAAGDQLEASTHLLGHMVDGGLKLQPEHRWLINTTRWLRNKSQDWMMLAEELDRQGGRRR